MQIKLSEVLNLLKKGEFYQARAICEKILEKEDKNSEVYNLHAFTLYFDKKFDKAIISWQKAIDINPKYIEAFNGLGNAYIKLKKMEHAIQSFEKAIKINPNYFEAYSNLGSALLKLKKYKDAIVKFEEAIKIKPDFSEAIYGKAYSLMRDKNFQDAIIFFKKFIELNPQSANAYNALGSCLISLSMFEESLNYLTKALNIQPDHKDALENLMNLLKFYQPKKNYSNQMIIINEKIRSNDFKFNSKLHIQDENIISYYNKIYEILKKNLPFNNFNEEQIFRRNRLILNCRRHFKVFNTYNIIPEYCFGCYKIQINLKNVLELFKLYFIFDNLKLDGNNIRKTMIETRPKIAGTYKGLIYCSGLNEAKKVLDIVYPIVRSNIDKKIILFIKRGCTEFNLLYPNFEKIDQSVKYKSDWKDKEIEIDKHYSFDEDTSFKNSISGMNINDALIMKNWLSYAKKIDDLSYKRFSLDIPHNEYIEDKLFNQIVFRKNEFLKN